jgi:hypothetical protein
VSRREAGDETHAAEGEHHRRRLQDQGHHDEGKAKPGREAQPDRQLASLFVCQAVTLRRQVRAHPNAKAHAGGGRSWPFGANS